MKNTFPTTFATASMIIGVIWMIQGFGLLETGSFMDDRSLWGYLGIAMFAGGLGAVLYKRRNGFGRRNGGGGDPK